MVTMGIFPFKEKSPWQNRESNPEPHDQQSETLTTRPRGWSQPLHVSKHYLLTMHCIYNNWYILWVLCRLAATRVGVDLPGLGFQSGKENHII
jgi:hypothetical protein